jgi:two-component system sensor histidine kinase AgrC
MYLNVTIIGVYIKSLSLNTTVLLIAIFVLYCLLGIAFIYMMHQMYKKSLELELKQQENERLTGYANLLEKQHEDMRIFKHDYMNILATISGYIQLKDMDKLSDYFKEKILNQGDIFKEDNNVKLIKKIESIPIRGMLYAKLIKAQKSGVVLNIDILQDIPLFEMNEIDVCKMLGILMDNAIEASSNSEDKTVLLTMEHIPGEIRVSINNSFVGTIEDIDLLYKKGYSTKGEGRGLGLYTVKMLVDNKKNNVKISTNVEGNRFIQQLVFYLKPSEI